MGEEADLWDPVVSGSREEEEIRAGGGGNRLGRALGRCRVVREGNAGPDSREMTSPFLFFFFLFSKSFSKPIFQIGF